MAHIPIVRDDGPRLIIDARTRRIEGCVVELVQGDHDSERIGFELPRYIDGHDMTEADAYIHYSNEESDEGHMYPVDDLHALPNSPSTVVFTWLASRNVTQEPGKVQFLVKFRCYDGENVVYEWNTALAKLVRVREGAAFEAEAVEVLPDIIPVWKAELEATVPRLLEETIQEAKDSGEFDGVGVVSVEQVELGVGSDAVNVVCVSLSDGKAFDFEVRNGSQGERGVQGIQGDSFEYEDFTQEQLEALRGPAGHSGVHLGSSTPPETANVWVVPDGEPSATEQWTFTLEDGTTVTKTVVVVD